ncbi:ATP-dependent DNA helicase Q5-like isoform X1 [Metopolophium dirhodum]|uniref:ATP-dependent DNA helicase Q5-like isoform X1 n=1 Tax=Metopolophium dirhodum TaxID=44670 RepID=UPI0029902790|nr:ATP-dependent DNA helicase Q5-like isoform X1 [Metopolophium dirhodum]
MDDESLLKYLRHYFHHSDFKNETQKDAILAILKRNTDVIVSFPSGYGRTMCYQLPSLIYLKRMTIVIIPLIARIMDQVNSLKRLEIHTEVITTLTTISEQMRIYGDLQSELRKSHFLYVTTDQASTSAFKQLLSHLIQTNNLSYIVVDETHCENQWIYGQKNNEYHTLGMLRKKYKEIPWIVVTATAGVDVVDFLRRVLYIKDDPKTCVRFSIPCYRPNLFYDVVQDNTNGVSVPHLKIFIDKYLTEEIVSLGSDSEKPSGLIFCKTREVTEQLVKDLKQNGISIAAYHAGLEEVDRSSVKDLFMKGHYQLLAVTSISGMEINKANIRLVVHWGLPSSVLTYYYESGQAGKDGNPARCRIYLTKRATSYYNPKNESMLAAAINSVNSIEQIQNSAKSFLVFLHSRYMKDFCEGLKCRHRFFSEYFGDERMECIDKCDVCSIVSHGFYGGRSAIRLEMLQMGMNTYIKNICSKYHELQKNNMLTTTDALNIMKVCDEFVKANNSNNPKATHTTFNAYEKMMKVSNVDVESLPSSSTVENDDKKDEDQLPSS